MTLPSKLKPPYRIGSSTYITTHRSRPADPATGPSILQRVASHLPVKVRGPKPEDSTAPGPSTTAPRAGRLPAASKGKGKSDGEPANFLDGRLPDELSLQIVDRLDTGSWKAFRLVNRAAAGLGSNVVKHLKVESGTDIAHALQAFPTARSLTAPWDASADEAAAEAIRSAENLRAVTLVDPKPWWALRDDPYLEIIAKSASINALNLQRHYVGPRGLKAVVDEGRVHTLDLSQSGILDPQHHLDTRILGEGQAIRELTVAECMLNGQDATNLAASTSIVKLVAPRNRFGPAAAAAFALNGAGRPDAPDGDTLANGQPARFIEEIDLSGNPLGGTGVRALAATRTIRSMKLDRTSEGLAPDIEPVVDDDMQALAACASLEALDVSFNQIGDAGARHLARSEKIRILVLQNGGIGDDGAQALAAMPKLEELSLANPTSFRENQITDTAGEAFASSPKLRKLELRLCDVGNRTALRLAASESLEDLGLASTLVDNDAAVALAKAPRLRRLDISFNLDIDDVGGTALAASKTLREVDLRGTRVGDKTAIAMARNPVIRKLDLSRCPNITAVGRAALEAQRHRFEELRL